MKTVELAKPIKRAIRPVQAALFRKREYHGDFEAVLLFLRRFETWLSFSPHGQR